MDTYITVDDIRAFILDRTVGDNDLHRDLAFSDEEIMLAMERAAREFRSLPPLVGCYAADALPTDTNMFFDGTAQQLYIAEASRLMRNDIDYDAGGVGTNLVSKEIKHLLDLSQMHAARFREAATAWKRTYNLSQAYGPLG